MPKSLLVFAVSFTPETPNFRMFGGVAYHSGGFFEFLFFNCVYAHISNLNYKNILIIQKNRIREFQGTEPP